MSKIATLEELYVEQLKDLYNAEIQLIGTLPEMAQAAHDSVLKADFELHLEQTYRHVERIERVLENLNHTPTGHKCDAMAALIKESKKWIHNDSPVAVKDAALIAIAQRIEHYEIAGYGCVRAYASLLGDDEAAGLLQTTLNEEVEADRGLTTIAEKLNVEAETFSSHR